MVESLAADIIAMYEADYRRDVLLPGLALRAQLGPVPVRQPTADTRASWFRRLRLSRPSTGGTPAAFAGQ